MGLGSHGSAYVISPTVRSRCEVMFSCVVPRNNEAINVITLKKYHEQRGSGIDMAVGCFTDVTVNSGKNYHQEHDRATLATSKAVVAAWGAVILSFQGVANLHK